MQIVKRTMGWIQKPSAYQYNQQLTAKRRALAKTYLNQQNALSNTIFSIKDASAHDFTALVLKSVVNRVSAEAQKRLENSLPDDLLTKVKSEIDKTA